MINNANIMKAIKTRLRADIPTIEVQSTDFKNVIPPCFMVENVAYSTTPVADNVNNIITTFNVVYFSAKNTVLDLVKVQNSLKLAFRKPLQIFDDDGGYRFLDVKSIDFDENKTDFVLTGLIRFDYVENNEITNEYNEYENNEIMVEIETSFEKDYK